MFFVLFFHVLYKISNLNMWTTIYSPQPSCTELTLLYPTWGQKMIAKEQLCSPDFLYSESTLKKIFPHCKALAESVDFKSRMMSFDKVKTFTNNLGPLFGHDAINRKAVRLRAIERKYKNSRYFCIGFWFWGLFGGIK